MKRQISVEHRPWIRAAVYSFMTLMVTVIVALLMLVVLGYQFNKKDGRIEQGGLLQFQSVPQGAAVSLDGLRLGSQTNTKTTVDTGNHFVEYNLDGYRTWQKSITITAGQIGWLSYARLIPTTITPQVQHSYTTLTGALSAPSDNYMLLHQQADLPAFDLVDIRGDTPQYTTLTLPAASYTAPSVGQTQTFTLESWSQDDNAILIQHTYNGNQTEWIYLNRGTPDKSININTSYGITPSKVQFAGNGNRLLFVRTDSTVRRINLDEQTLSRPLATDVDHFTGFDDKTIVYSTTPDAKNQRTAAYAAIDIDTPVTLGTYPADGQPLFAAMGNYFGQPYVGVVHGQTLTITTGSLPTLTSKGSMKPFATETIPAGISNLDLSQNDRFFVSTLPTGYATYDIELSKYDDTSWDIQSSMVKPINWLDDYTLWSDNGGELRLYEFDGANQQNIMPAAEGFAASVTPNNKYIYDVAKTDKGYTLQRALLILH
jgi:hypothetical protein